MANPFMNRLRDHQMTLMVGIRTSRTPDVVRMAAAHGYEAIMVDLEHSTMSLDVAVQLCQVAHDLHLTAMVRVPEREYGAIGRLLDGGAHGIVAPRIQTVEEAADVRAACLFPPLGHRSAIAMVPSRGFRPTPAATLNPLLDEATIVEVLIETAEGCDIADGIAGVEGVDILGIGANDLAAELGDPGNFASDAFRAAVGKVISACRAHDKLCVIGGIGDTTVLAELEELGAARLRLTGSDSDMLFAGMSERASKFRD